MSIYYRFLLEMTQKEKDTVNNFMVMKLHKFLNEIGTDEDAGAIRGIVDKLRGVTSAPQEVAKEPTVTTPEIPPHRTIECINLCAQGTFSHFLLEYQHGVDKGDFLLVVSVEGKASVFGITPTYIELDRPTEEDIPMTANAFKIDNPVLNKVLQDILTGRQELVYQEDPRLKDKKTAHKQYEKPQEPKKRGDSGIYGDFMKQVQDTKQAGSQWQPSTSGAVPQTRAESVHLFKNIIQHA